VKCGQWLNKFILDMFKKFVKSPSLATIFTSYLIILMLSGQFGPRTLWHQDISALNYSAEVSGQFGTGAEVSQGHFGTGQFGTNLYERLRHHYMPTHYTDGFRSVCGR